MPVFFLSGSDRRAVKFFKKSPLERGQGVCKNPMPGTHPFIPSQEGNELNSPGIRPEVQNFLL